MNQLYVAYVCEHLRDGNEEAAMIFSDTASAMAWINKHANSYAGGNCDFKLFKLGEEIPIKEGAVEEPRPPIKTRVFEVQQ